MNWVQNRPTPAKNTERFSLIPDHDQTGRTTSRTNPPIFILGRHITPASSPVSCQTLQTLLCMSVSEHTKTGRSTQKHVAAVAERASFARTIQTANFGICLGQYLKRPIHTRSLQAFALPLGRKVCYIFATNFAQTRSSPSNLACSRLKSWIDTLIFSGSVSRGCTLNPRRDRRREQLKSRAKGYSEQGQSVPWIARRLGFCRTTIREWLRSPS